MGSASWEAIRRLLGSGVLLLALGVSAAEPAGPLAAPAGQSIYRDGLHASGEPVLATARNGVALSGAVAACANCHRRSGLGGSEGQTAIGPIAGRLLFAQGPTARVGRPTGASGGAMRAPYTGHSLALALRDGIDPGGRPLDALMPRYQLSDQEVAQLKAYLEGLSPAAVPGVNDREIHFSTIIAPDVSADRRRAMLDVMRAFFRDKNGGTRQETRRREVGSEPMYRAFRTWVLHVWELRGAPETWTAQLRAYYRQQPVFAVIGGVGGGSWQPVHAFCETLEVPCVFPDVDYPELADTGHYPLYFSRGLALEAEVLAKHLLDSDRSSETQVIVQVYRDDPLGRIPAQVLRRYLQGKGARTILDYPLADAGGMPAELLARLASRQSLLVVWLDSSGLDALGLADAPPERVTSIYVSASLTAMKRPRLPEGWLGKLGMVYPFDLPGSREQRLRRLKSWLRARNIPLDDERTQANAFFAATVAGEAMSHLGENFSREYFIERIEQMTQSSLSPSMYPHLSLGPGQRYASRGGYIVRFPSAAPVAVSEWLIP